MNSYKTYFVRQHDQVDCGVASLASIVQYFGYQVTLDKLRNLSGTTSTGTTLLGLMQAANNLGFKAEGFEADIEHIKNIKSPFILHLLIDKKLLHYVVCFGYHSGKFIICDPGKGIESISSEELDTIWESKRLLLVEKGSDKIKLGNWEKPKSKWNKVFSIIEYDLSLLSISILLSITVAGLGLATAVFSQQLIDKILPSRDQSVLFSALTILGIILIAKAALSYAKQYLFNKQAKHFNQRMISFFYKKLLHLKKAFFDSKKTGDLSSRMNDTVRIQSTVTYLFSSVLIDAMVSIIITVFILFYSPLLGLVLLIVNCVFIAISWSFNNTIIDKQRSVLSSYANNEANYIDTVQGIEAIKTDNKEPLFAKVTKQTHGILQENVFSLGMIEAKFLFIMDIYIAIIALTAFGFGAYAYFNEMLLLGEMVAVIQAILFVVPSVVIPI